MNVSQWGIGQLMQLPDCCFGSRFEVVLGARVTAAATVYTISPMALPDKCVIWQASLFWPWFGTGAATILANVQVVLGDHLPIAAAEFNALEDVFPGAENYGGGQFIFRQPVNLTKLRKPIAAQGRRLIVSFTQTTTAMIDMLAAFVISSMPTEVPDCLLSGLDKSRM